MPKRVSAANLVIGKSVAFNSGIYTAQITGTSDTEISARLNEYKIKMHDDVLKANESIQ